MKDIDKSQQYIEGLRNWINGPQPRAEEITEFKGISREELERQFASHYIPHDSHSGNLELTADNGLISCMINNGVCTRAYFISNEDD
jgi:hypothetical protein